MSKRVQIQSLKRREAITKMLVKELKATPIKNTSQVILDQGTQLTPATTQDTILTR
jgi:hypothetical protein